jgi:ABC-type uncharacterized transport system permease subunit
MKNISATRVVASTLGVLVGLAGVDHGVFEILQGNVAPSGPMIDAIGPAQRFWEHGTETALTIVPSFLLTGILAVIVGLLVALWAAAFVHKKYGGAVLMLLSIVLFLVGGGFAPIFVAVLASLAATRINKPLTGWRTRLPNGVRNALAKVWLGSTIAFVLVFLISVEIAILGWPLTLWLDADTAFNLLNTVAYITLGLMVFSIVTALAHDAQVQGEKTGQAGGGAT